MLPVKMTADQRQRFKVACAEEGLSYAGLVLKLLDERDAKLARRRAAQAHPFHRPATVPETANQP
jgi:hypothetical protein